MSRTLGAAAGAIILAALYGGEVVGLGAPFIGIVVLIVALGYDLKDGDL